MRLKNIYHSSKRHSFLNKIRPFLQHLFTVTVLVKQLAIPQKKKIANFSFIIVIQEDVIISEEDTNVLKKY